jgi:hypothetical protein
VTFSGGGTVSMFGGGSLTTDSGGSNTLTNVNDKIVGVGGPGGDLSLFVINEDGGVIDGRHYGRTEYMCYGNKRWIDGGDSRRGLPSARSPSSRTPEQWQRWAPAP